MVDADLKVGDSNGDKNNFGKLIDDNGRRSSALPRCKPFVQGAFAVEETYDGWKKGDDEMRRLMVSIP